MKIDIIPFEEKYSLDFHDLNMAWLKTYFYVESHDKKVLQQPSAYIIERGGFIFFAKYRDQIVGTVALIKEEQGFELSKMAVTPEFQGLKIGRKLMKHCIEFAKQKGWTKLLLYSNKQLKPALHLYASMGFVEVPLEKDVYYERANIKMELIL